jgi:hypothetical protein
MFIGFVAAAFLVCVGLKVLAVVRRTARRRRDQQDWPSEAGLY